MTRLVDGQQTFLNAIFECINGAETRTQIGLDGDRQFAKQFAVGLLVATVGAGHPGRPALFVRTPTGSLRIDLHGTPF